MNKNFSGYFLLFALILSPFFSHAQSTKWKPWIVPELGLMAGSYSPAADLRLQGGVQKKGWLIGIGCAIDLYRYATVPVYAQLRKMIGTKSSRPFVIGSLGANINTKKNTSSGLEYQQFYSGRYVEAGVGWAFRHKKKSGFNLSLSYTHKTLTEHFNSAILDGNGGVEINVNETKYLMNPIAFRFGLQF